VFRNFSVGVLALALAACGAPKARHGGEQHPHEPFRPADLQFPGKRYRVDESQSELRVLVYRAGPLARLGHNHVVVNRALRGAVSLAEGASAFQLTVPAAGFAVDDAQARGEEGLDFAANVPEGAKSGTLQNMLGTAVLDADEFPVITVDSVAVSAIPDAPDSGKMTATVRISVAGHESTLEVPFALQSDSSRLSATGSLALRQSALGLTPYSLMLGALQVQDLITIKFKIVALPG
jgi:YceI-like protein